MTETDRFYLDDEELARQLIELGVRGVGDPLKRSEFEAAKSTEKSFCAVFSFVV